MRRFTQLYNEIDQTTSTSGKLAALERYFAAAPPADAAWALYLLTGRRLVRAISSRRLRVWAAEEAGIPLWLLDECHEAAGDLSETLALVLPDGGRGTDLSLAELIETRLLPLEQAGEAEQRARLVATWRELDAQQRFLFHKLITRSFRVGAAGRLVIRALAGVSGVDAATLSHRLMGHWRPSAADYARLVAHDPVARDPAQPYPFMLAYPLDVATIDLGAARDWQAEWKWDGIRAQLIHRADVYLWSRGEELINRQFPELVAAGRTLPDGLVLDGEILAWEAGRPLPFAALQRRLNRKRVEPTLWPEVPVVFLAFDLLESGGQDVRTLPLAQRRRELEARLDDCRAGEWFCLSPLVEFGSWSELDSLQPAAREHGAEGLMLKRRDSPYGVGRQRGPWWKWKIEPYRVDAVLIYAQPGSGKRASLYTDYTFGVWHAGELVPVAKAYSGLTDEEIREVDAFVRRHAIARHGPVRVVEPRLVFELAFQGVQRSDRHKAGVALRFPRIANWRRDKPAGEADTLEMVRALLAAR